MNNNIAMRGIDDLGRIAIPKEMRIQLGIAAGDSLEISIENGTIHIQKPCISDNRCICCGEVIPEGRQVCPNCEVKANDALHGGNG